MSDNIQDNEKTFTQTQNELIMSDEFENALVSGAEIENTDIPLCKSRNKNNYSHFYDIMVASNRDIQSILDMKKKDRSNEENEKLKEFKKTTSKTYKQVCKLLVSLLPPDLEDEDEEEVEQEQETYIEKMVHRITDIAKLLNYIGEPALEDEFKKYGIELKFDSMTKEEFFAQEHIKEQITSAFNSGRDISRETERTRNRIKHEIYHETVPVDLQYDKNSNPTGIKDTDFCKLVSIKAKLLSAKDNDDEQEKVKDKAEKVATEYVFQNRRNEILNKKVTEFAS